MRVDSTLNLQTRVFPFLRVNHTKFSFHSKLSPYLPVYLTTSAIQISNSPESIFSTALLQRSNAQPQKSKSIVEIFAWIAAHNPQPTSDIIIFNFMRAIIFEEAIQKY